MTKLLKYLNKTAKEKEKLMKNSSKERDNSIKIASDKEYYFNKKNNEFEEAKTARNQIEEGNVWGNKIATTFVLIFKIHSLEVGILIG